MWAVVAECIREAGNCRRVEVGRCDFWSVWRGEACGHSGAPGHSECKVL